MPRCWRRKRSFLRLTTRRFNKGLGQISTEIESGAFEWKLDLEDVHLNIEARLTTLVGDAGKRLHTGRSRNDQVATDVRLWLRGEIDLIGDLLTELQKALLTIAEKNVEVILPGFTHLQVAQPVSFGHHMLAYVEMFSRDAERLQDVRRRVNRLPLGAAALAGTSYPLDRERVAKTLGMVDAEGHPQVCQNSLDAVSDRDFAIEFTAAASLAMVHISRLSEELILWMSQSFGFIQIGDAYTTGSSIMPQKKNPDVPELARGKTGRVVGHLMGLITLMKGQPLAYNKDNQEDKEPLFDTVDTLKDTLRIFAEMMGSITVKPEAMERAALKGYATATDLADYMVKKACLSATPTKPSPTPSKPPSRIRLICRSCHLKCCSNSTRRSRKTCTTCSPCAARSMPAAGWVAQRQRRCGCRLPGTPSVWASLD